MNCFSTFDIYSCLYYCRGNSLRNAASVAYAEVFSPHHGWAIRKAVAAGMYALPTKSQLLKKLNEDGESSCFASSVCNYDSLSWLSHWEVFMCAQEVSRWVLCSSAYSII